MEGEERKNMSKGIKGLSLHSIENQSRSFHNNKFGKNNFQKNHLAQSGNKHAGFVGRKPIEPFQEPLKC